jgi:hypothetical protein
VLGGDGLLHFGPEASEMADDASPTAEPDEHDRRPDGGDGENGTGDTDGGRDAGTTNEDGRTDADLHAGDPREADDPVAASEPAEPDSDPADEGDPAAAERGNGDDPAIPAEVERYERFTKIEGASYERANGFLRDRTHITAREWAIARLCTDFRTETGVEMTKIGENLPGLVPFMTDTYTPQAVNQARASFEEKVRKAGATFLYGAMSDFFTAEDLDDVMYEATEIAKFLLEVEGADLAVESELAAEDRISSVMREVHRQSAALRHDDVTCPHCSHTFEPSAENDAEE